MFAQNQNGKSAFSIICQHHPQILLKIFKLTEYNKNFSLALIESLELEVSIRNHHTQLHTYQTYLELLCIYQPASLASLNYIVLKAYIYNDLNDDLLNKYIKLYPPRKNHQKTSLSLYLEDLYVKNVFHSGCYFSFYPKPKKMQVNKKTYKTLLANLCNHYLPDICIKEIIQAYENKIDTKNDSIYSKHSAQYKRFTHF